MRANTITELRTEQRAWERLESAYNVSMAIESLTELIINHCKNPLTVETLGDQIKALTVMEQREIAAVMQCLESEPEPMN